MIVDTSALMCIVKGETDAERCSEILARHRPCTMSAANLVEASIVIDAARDPIASREFDDLIREAALVIEPVTESQARIARDAYHDFGKDSGHRAQLNFGDCFAYALAVDKREPLLYIGNDFVHTGIRSALE